MAIALMREGKRVGVTSLSHKAIHNFLRAVQHEADRQGYAFCRREARRPGERDRVREPVRRHLDRHGRLRRPGVPARRGDGVGVLAGERRHPCGRAAARRALRRRGRPAGARRRARGRHGRAVARPARRPEPAAAGLAGIAPGGLGRLGARASPRRPRDGAARPRALPRGDVAAPAGALRVHVGRVLRGAARSRAGHRAAEPRARQRGAVDPGRARGARPVVGRGGERDRRPRSKGCSGRRSPTSTA